MLLQILTAEKNVGGINLSEIIKNISLLPYPIKV
jgi:hypothetical protein